MIISDNGVTLIKSFESCQLVAYQDQRGIWTIGWGHRLGITEGMVWTQEVADGWLLFDLEHAEECVSGLAGTAEQPQFDAMTSLTYNIGSGGFLSSSVLRFHRAGQFPQAASAFLMWDMETIDGRLVFSPGLLRRRQLERTFYLGLA